MQLTFNNQVTFIDLFAGIGGFRLAMERFGGTCVFSSEYDRHAQTTYQANFGEMPSGDITEIQAEDIPAHDVLCAGFPCQAFSISGKQRGFEDSRGTLFFDIARITEHHKPSVLFLENVPNLRGHNNGETLRRMKEILREMDYVVHYKILNASDYGVPQSRRRLYLIAIHERVGISEFAFPPTDKKDIALEDILLSNKETKPYFIRRNDMVLKKDTTKRQLRPVRIGTIGKGGQGNRIYSTKGHAITLSAYGGGAGAKTGAYLVDGVIRKLAPEECKRVQGFPRDYILPKEVSDNQFWQQFGNSVAVPVLDKIVEEFIHQEIL